MESTSLKLRDETLTRLTYANLVSVQQGSYHDTELPVRSMRDPSEVMQQLPADTLYFYFYDCIVGNVEEGDDTIRVYSEKLDISGRHYVDITGVYTRKQVTGWWKSWQEKRALDLMDKHGTNYAVYWAVTKTFLYHRSMAYNSKVDVLLNR
jgi:hypothetical protein